MCKNFINIKYGTINELIGTNIPDIIILNISSLPLNLFLDITKDAIAAIITLRKVAVRLTIVEFRKSIPNPDTLKALI
jgi:hypothetical protein